MAIVKKVTQIERGNLFEENQVLRNKLLNKKTKMKRLSSYVFVILLLASIFLAAMSLKNKEWESLTAVISLIIAIISGWIAYETFHKQTQASKAQIIVRLDFESRYDIILLVVENLGSKPAFNIKLKWNQELKNLDGEKIQFNKFDKNFDIPVLNPNERTSVIVDVASRFYSEIDSKENLDYDGIIYFQESLSLKKKTSYPFQFSFKHYNFSPSFENETPRTMFELQKIPKQLENIKNEIKTLSKQINKPNA